MNWYVYIIECADSSLYTGITNNLEKRVKKHNEGKGSKAVLGKRPVKLVYFESVQDKIAAAKREREIKGWTRVKKLKLINGQVYRPPLVKRGK